MYNLHIHTYVQHMIPQQHTHPPAHKKQDGDLVTMHRPKNALARAISYIYQEVIL